MATRKPTTEEELQVVANFIFRCGASTTIYSYTGQPRPKHKMTLEDTLGALRALTAYELQDVMDKTGYTSQRDAGYITVPSTPPPSTTAQKPTPVLPPSQPKDDPNFFNGTTTVQLQEMWVDKVEELWMVVNQLEALMKELKKRTDGDRTAMLFIDSTATSMQQIDTYAQAMMRQVPLVKTTILYAPYYTQLKSTEAKAVFSKQMEVQIGKQRMLDEPLTQPVVDAFAKAAMQRAKAVDK